MLNKVTKIFLENKINHVSKKRIIFAITLAIAFISLNLSLIIINDAIFAWQKDNLNKNINITKSLLQSELNNLSQKADQLSELDDLKKSVKDKDIIKIISVLNEATKKNNIESAIISDENGVVLSRTKDLLDRGDYFLHTTDWGQSALKGEKYSFFGPGRESDLEMISTTPIYDNKEIIGIIVIGKTINDGYATALKNKILNSKINLTFRSPRQIVTGTSFSDESTKKILLTNLASDTRWIDDFHGHKNRITNMGNKSYLVGTIALQGVNKKNGDLIIFYTFMYFTEYILPVVVLFFLFLFCAFSYMRKKQMNTKSYKILLVMICFIFLFATFLWNSALCNRIYEQTTLKRDYQYKIYNSTIKFDPEYGIMDKYFSRRIAVNVASGGEAINAARIIINFDPKKIYVEEIITDNSICKADSYDMFIEKKIDNKNGEVIISCGLPSPGFSGPKGIIAEITIMPLEEGALALKFNKKSQVLANDGLGTNVLRESLDSGYIITSSYAREEKDRDQRIILFSPSHPNNEQWYSDKNVKFNWDSSWADQYYYLLDYKPFTTPTAQNYTRENHIELNTRRDGIFYFHVAGIKNNDIKAVRHYKVKIDCTPPSTLSVKISDNKIDMGNIIRMEINAADQTSGLQSDYFYIKIDNDIYLPTMSPLFIPFTESGKHQISVMTYDKANNSKEEQVEIDVHTGKLFDFSGINWEKLTNLKTK